MESRHIAPSFVHREIDQKKEEIRNSTVLHLNKFKARRKRLSTSESVDSKLKVDVNKDKPKDEVISNDGDSNKVVPDTNQQKKLPTKKVFLSTIDILHEKHSLSTFRRSTVKPINYNHGHKYLNRTYLVPVPPFPPTQISVENEHLIHFNIDLGKWGVVSLNYVYDCISDSWFSGEGIRSKLKPFDSFEFPNHFRF